MQAANAGGVAVSGLEMSQNAMRLQWSTEEVDNKLKASSLKWLLCCQVLETAFLWSHVDMGCRQQASKQQSPYMDVTAGFEGAAGFRLVS